MSNQYDNLFNQSFETTIIIILAIIYVSIIYIILGIFITYQLDKYVFFTIEKDFITEEIDRVSLLFLVVNICITFSIISVISYIIRNIVQNIPFPFNFNNLIDFHNIREVYTGSLFIIILIAFSQTLSKQYKEIKYKLSGKIY